MCPGGGGDVETLMYELYNPCTTMFLFFFR